MIRSFRHKGLYRFFEHNDARGIRQDLAARCRRRLNALHRAEILADLQLPGFDFHALHGAPRRYTIHLNGPWCITFEWEEGDAYRVDLEQYH